MEDTLAARELDSAIALLCAGVEGVTEAEVVVLLVCLLCAKCTSLLAMIGFSEWTCSMAARSLLKTPSWNFGDSACRTECRADGSTASSNDENASQLINELSSVDFLSVDPKAPSSRELKTNALRKPIILVRCDDKTIGPVEERSAPDAVVSDDGWMCRR